MLSRDGFPKLLTNLKSRKDSLSKIVFFFFWAIAANYDLLQKGMVAMHSVVPNLVGSNEAIIE
jgi:hypothetical protein